MQHDFPEMWANTPEWRGAVKIPAGPPKWVSQHLSQPLSQARHSTELVAAVRLPGISESIEISLPPRHGRHLFYGLIQRLRMAAR